MFPLRQVPFYKDGLFHAFTRESGVQSRRIIPGLRGILFQKNRLCRILVPLLSKFHNRPCKLLFEMMIVKSFTL